MTACPTRDQLRVKSRSTGSALRESSRAFEAALVMTGGLWTEDGRTAGAWEGSQDKMAFWSDVTVALGLFEVRGRGPVGS